MVDWQSIAEIAPVLGAGLSGNPQTLQATMQGYGMGQKIKKDQSLRSFGRELTALGHPPSEMEVQQIASKHGIDPITAQALVSTFMEYRNQQRLMDLKEREFSLHEKEFERKGKIGDLDELSKRIGIKKGLIDLGRPLPPVAGTPEAEEWERKKSLISQEGRMTNMPPWFDSYALEKLGEGIKDPQKMADLRNFLTTPEGKAEVASYRQKYASENATPLYLPREVETGPSAINARTGQWPGQESGGGGEKVRPKLSEDYKKDRAALGQAWDLVNTLRSKWNEVASNSRIGGSLTRAAGRVGLEPQAKLYGDSRDAVLGQLSRSIAMERGVLTNQDIERISKAIPILSLNPLETDTAEEADLKWKLIEEIIANAEKRTNERREMGVGEIKPIIGVGKPEPTQTTKPLTDKAKAAEYLKKAGGDVNKARELAKQDGWSF